MLSYRVRRNVLASLVAVGAPSATTLVLMALSHYVAIPNISLLYLPSILLVAVYFGTWPSLLAATVAAAEYDFFLIKPLFTLDVGQAADILALVVFLIVAAITSQLASGARARADAAQRRAAESAMLYELGQALMSSHEVSDVLETITRQIAAVFDLERCAVFVPGEKGRLVLAAEVIHGRRDRASEAAASYAYQQGAEIGLPDQPGTGSSQRLYIPIRTAARVLGVLEVGRKRSGEPLDEDDRRLLPIFAAQAALAMDRAESEEERTRLGVLEESDRLKSALLSAVSHDLRTPLATIKASATSLLLDHMAWTGDEGREMLEAIDQEADRLNRLVGNLLDLSRIEAGVLHPVLDWYGVQEVVEEVLPRLRPLLGERPFTVDVQPGVAPLRIDLLRIEELIYNLVENAVKYSPPASSIELRVRQMEETVCIEVVDHGPGVPEQQRVQVFETFYRGIQHTDRNPGTGLGLAICRGIAEVHGGRIDVTETPGGGATFTVTLPSAPVEQEARA